ncbi:ABC transporter permease [Streptococcus moroccensis]|uniref:ABC-2 type transport system permease protein n=1 Tax=Streptococcus moroccensis TaxID=1451356 RepID=A0ABT9YTD4_9STRE|nr:ABC transporter permease [Streptococcus moroccensis]MDQ0223254.1 ABC-2 type transport system permease protein [Streptococcus moroccensis]
MNALLKNEIILTFRTWPVFIMAVGLPLFFFLFYSSMDMYKDPEMQKAFVQSYMLTMTAFSMSSFGFFSFPVMIHSDKSDHYLTYIEHSPLSIRHYYLAKIIRVLVYYLISILVTFSVGAFVRGVELPPLRWLGAILLLLLASFFFLSLGLLLAQIPSQQVMTIVANIAFLGLAIIGGSWMPIETFPKWLQNISKLTPTYHVNQVVVQYAKDGDLLWKSLGIVLIYAIIISGIALAIKHRTEVD